MRVAGPPLVVTVPAAPLNPGNGHVLAVEVEDAAIGRHGIARQGIRAANLQRAGMIVVAPP